MIKINDSGLTFRGQLSKLDLSKIDGIVFHHLVAETATPDDIHSWHLDNGWAGFGYNFYIRKSGRIYEGRGFNQGAHARGHNSTKIGISFEGSFQANDSMTDAQVQHAIAIVRFLFERLGRKVKLYVHSDVGITTCAGRYFRLNDIKNGLKEDTSKGRNIDMILRNGSKGQNVEQLQSDLVELGYSLPRFGVDGKYGNEVKQAVIQFQKDYNLQVDGIAGPETLGKIENLLQAEEELYRVQVGAFSKKENADRMIKSLEDAGFETYIVKG